MTDKPILFSGPMIRALLDGRKTQTRRVMKPPYGTLEYLPDGTWRPICTKFFPGDRLWVKETHCFCGQMNSIKSSDLSKLEPVGYLADGNIREASCSMISRGRTRPSIYMPRWASRLTLTVTDVRVQRVQEITQEDVAAEGWRGFQHDGGPLTWFHTLWDSLNEARGFGWNANPWVIALTFDVHRCNIDQMEASR